MTGSTIAFVILAPFTAVFVYAAWHEWRRARKDGHSNYGLSYDPETDTTHVTLLDEGETGYHPGTDGSSAGAGDGAPDPAEAAPDDVTGARTKAPPTP